MKLLRHRYIYAALGIAGAFFIFHIFFTKEASLPEATASANLKPIHFSIIPLDMASSTIPQVVTQIDGEIFLLSLDLGFEGEFALNVKHLDKIPNKKLVKTRKMYNFTGNVHLAHSYQLSKASIPGISWWEPIVHARSDESQQETRISNGKRNSFNRRDGTIGWQSFQETNLFLDLGKGRAAVCGELNTLKEHGYGVDSWVQAPLFTDRGLVECEITTSDGTLHCLLDTGSTWNLLNRELPGKSIAEACFDPINFAECPSFKINEVEFGPIVFRQVPVKLPVSFPVVLGMEFFLKHQVFIDFVRGYVYFSPPTEEIAKAE